MWGGWIGELSIGDAGVIDFAGGTAVHINAGAAALAVCIILGKRRGWPRTPMRPHNLTMVMLGAGLLWFGWFGQRGLGVRGRQHAAIAATNTLLATCAADAWLIVEKIRDEQRRWVLHRASSRAWWRSSACANVTPMGAILLGLVAGAVCAWAVTLKYKLGFDDSFDVVGIHWWVASWAPGLHRLRPGRGRWSERPAVRRRPEPAHRPDHRRSRRDGLLLILAGIIALALKATIGIRSDEEDEVNGIDVAEHAETAYELGDSGAGGAFAGVGHTARAKEVE